MSTIFINYFESELFIEMDQKIVSFVGARKKCYIFKIGEQSLLAVLNSCFVPSYAAVCAFFKFQVFHREWNELIRSKKASAILKKNIGKQKTELTKCQSF